MSLLDAGLAALDALHEQDPARVVVEGREVPAELDYARRMSRTLASLVPAPSVALQLAVRAQHLERWTLPRADYPAGKAGYHAWRTEQKKRHARRAAHVLSEVGLDEATCARVASLVEKRGRDDEAQALEDAACLVFLESQLVDFAAETDRRKLIGILQKTWRKMSEAARDRALGLPLDAAARALVLEALG